MSEPRRHPDLFTAEEAIEYLRLDSIRSLDTLRENWGLRPIGLGKAGLYHRRHLDELVEKAAGGIRKADDPPTAAGDGVRPLQSAGLRLRLKKEVR